VKAWPGHARYGLGDLELVVDVGHADEGRTLADAIECSRRIGALGIAAQAELVLANA
jgi:hypothetical protein